MASVCLRGYSHTKKYPRPSHKDKNIQKAELNFSEKIVIFALLHNSAIITIFAGFSSGRKAQGNFIKHLKQIHNGC